MLINAVAPFAGAWIEIPLIAIARETSPSLPSRERGLKYETVIVSIHAQVSLPSRERGLKFSWYNVKKLLGGVAPFAGAWIEIQ